MTDFQILNDLGLVVIGSVLLLVASRPLRVPPILTYMLTGLALGPVTGLLGVSESVDVFSELGIALLLFVVGLELSIDKIREIGRTALVTAAAQVALTFGLGFGLARILGFPGTAAAMVGLVTAFSSTVVVVKLLDRTGDLGSLHGRLSIGILLVQDVLVAGALMLLGAFGRTAGEGAGSPWTGLAVAFLGFGGLVLVGAAAGRWILPGLVKWLSDTPEGLFVVALTWAFAFILAAEAIHVSVELGAFVAGVVLAQLPYNEELKRRTHPLVDFFLAVFFVSLGARMDLAAMGASWPAALVVSAFVLLVKPALIAVLLGLQGQPPREAFLSGLTLGQISEFAFILAGLAATAGLVGPEFFGFVGLVGFVTIGTSAVLVPRGAALAELLDSRGILRHVPGTPEDVRPVAPPLRGHVVVIGMNTLGRFLVERFRALGEQVLAVDTDAEKLVGVDAETLVGDVTSRSVMETAGVPHARLVVSTLQIEDVNSLVAYRCSRLGVPVSVHAFEPSLIHELLEIGADHVMVSKHDGIPLMEQEVRRLGVMG